MTDCTVHRAHGTGLIDWSLPAVSVSTAVISIRAERRPSRPTGTPPQLISDDIISSRRRAEPNIRSEIQYQSADNCDGGSVFCRCFPRAVRAGISINSGGVISDRPVAFTAGVISDRPVAFTAGVISDRPVALSINSGGVISDRPVAFSRSDL